jgi:hypothetical protein
MSKLSHHANIANAGSVRAAHQGITDNIQSLAEIRQEVEAQRRVLLHLIFKQCQGQPLEPHEDPIRTWLGLPKDATMEMAMERLHRTQAKVVGTSACPSCGAQIQALEGVTVDQCQWCGAMLTSER